MPFHPIRELIDDFRQGKMVLLVDDEDRENEGDLLLAAQFCTPQAINFMAREARGLICLTLTDEHCQRLGLEQMVPSNGSVFSTAFTVSIEAASGITTGISAADRAHTVLTAVAPGATAADLVQPGQILFEMAGGGTTEVLVALDEKNLEVLALGQSARCIADAYPRQPFAAELDFIAPSIDPQRGTVEVRLAVAAAPDFLRQDMTVSVTIQTGAQDSAIVVPNDALADLDGERPHLMLD